MKSFTELAKSRASIRAFKNEQIPQDLLEKVLDAGRIAPSACNFQPWHFVVVQNPQQLNRLSECYKLDWFRTAPTVIAVCIDSEKAWVRRNDEKSYADVDAAIAVDHMTLCAEELNLGTCWVAAFKPKIVREVLELPDEIEPVVLLPIGWPDEIPSDTPRKTLDEIVHYDKW